MSLTHSFCAEAAAGMLDEELASILHRTSPDAKLSPLRAAVVAELRSRNPGAVDEPRNVYRAFGLPMLPFGDALLERLSLFA